MKKAFTLIELMVVIAIIFIISGLVFSGFKLIKNKSEGASRIEKTN